ncbi:MAG: hypothetical protein M1826_002010 [Phylliscum demangeonii]|nr:MAG: hypothetical protein M1826_002010 [Phylliscum demangeonii]
MADRPRTPSSTLTVLISGSGTNLRALIQACAPYDSPSLSPSSSTSHCSSNHLREILSHLPPHTTIARVIYNRKAAAQGVGIAAALKALIPTTYHNLLAYEAEAEAEAKHEVHEAEGPDGVKRRARERYDRDLAALVLADMPVVVVLAGFMHVVSPAFLDPLRMAGILVINLHPALPGMYPGAGALRRQYEDFQNGRIDRVGIMVHEVIPEVDMGRAICVREIPLSKRDRLSDFEERVHRHEW